jgi:hypothetical protein
MTRVLMRLGGSALVGFFPIYKSYSANTYNSHIHTPHHDIRIDTT